MLETLRKHDDKEVQRILSSLTSELLPDPGIDVRKPLKLDPKLHSQLWSEIRRRTKVDPADPSTIGRSKLFEFLFNEMSQIALPRSSVDLVKAKLSRSGELRPDLYDVRFSSSFATSRAHGVRPNHVLEAIRNADDVEHLNLFDNKQLISLFVRIHDNFPTENRFLLLVVSAREGADLEVTDAMRVYFSDVDITAANRPSDILRCLTEKYGFFMTAGHITSKFIIDETLTVEGPLDPKTFIKVHAPHGKNVWAKALAVRRNLYNSFGIALAFALDQEKYADDLRRHGIRVEDLEFRDEPVFWRLGSV